MWTWNANILSGSVPAQPVRSLGFTGRSGRKRASMHWFGRPWAVKKTWETFGKQSRSITLKWLQPRHRSQSLLPVPPNRTKWWNSGPLGIQCRERLIQLSANNVHQARFHCFTNTKSNCFSADILFPHLGEDLAVRKRLRHPMEGTCSFRWSA